ncbi:uncharacterized protein BO95DRAFT_412688 [Aspergillus brunneoviolaceus CBS 621.78]|uniref:Uncharacterized protein n=1 Tax=Aspergillus brunneoviolaceus CBS 621.78 TaxID=1450534 RepID=A0ACD1GAF7_9EURO|nr:hypothetical protein BO95DRAFT_412688 [Aspergillus brunneoviolaceus CBS 621.78]RAH46238.1 hypothetical protein BO95DRAFT_412688 [Aspergillus brunneoviolaceus CBS 621.78]
MAAAAVHLPTGDIPSFPASNTLPPQTKSTPQPRTSPHDVHTVLNYIKEVEDGSHLRPNYAGKADSFERPSESVPTTIHDVSGHEAEYTLDGYGFQFHPHVSAEKDFLDDEQIKRVYYPEVDRLLKEVTGATRTYIFDHTIRRPAANAQAQLRTPVHRVHIDQSFPAAVSRVSHHLPDDAEELLKGRHQIINVWRPLKTVRRDPLAVAEAHTVDDADLVPIKLIYPDREGETYAVRANPATKWYYRHAQTPEWVTLIKCYDSKTDGRARRVPHSAFVIPGTENEEARESIEVRVLVFTPEDRE